MYHVRSLRGAVALPVFAILCCVPARAVVVYVASNASGAVHDGGSWATAFLTVQNGINAASAGDDVWVAAGTYVGPITLKAGLSLYGGFAGAETSLSQRDSTQNVCILDGGGYTPPTPSYPPEQFNTAPAVWVATAAGETAVLDGFTVRNGSGAPLEISRECDTWNRGCFVHYGYCGAGIYIPDGSPVISHNTITSNVVGSTWGGFLWQSLYSGATIGGGRGGGLYIGQGSASVSDNTFTGNGGNVAGGCVYIAAGSPVLARNTFSGNTGGGIYVKSGTAVITGNTISGNTGAGISQGTGVIEISHNVISGNHGATQGAGVNAYNATVTDNTIANNATTSAPNRQYNGGGAYVVQGTVLRNTFSGNAAAGTGGGLQLGNGTATGNTFINNTATTTGGGLQMGSGSLSNNTFTGNTAPAGGGVYAKNVVMIGNIFTDNLSPVYDGAGAYVVKGTVAGNTFTGNAAEFHGGGLYIAGGTVTDNRFSGNSAFYGGGLWGVAVVSRNSFRANKATGGIGGGACTDGGAVFSDNLFAENEAGQLGGGIDIIASSAAPAKVVNNTFVRNSANGGGAAIAFHAGDAPASASTVVANNVVALNGSGVFAVAGSAPTFTHNDVWNNTTNFAGLTDPTGTNGNINVDPAFMNSDTGDYHLRAGSPCIDTGDDAYAQSSDTDLDGLPRMQGTHVDLGCYEFTTPTLIIGDVLSALKIAGGMSAGSPYAFTRLNADQNTRIDVLDAVRLARKVAGLEPNP